MASCGAELVRVAAKAENWCMIGAELSALSGCDALCLATAANAMGGGAIIDEPDDALVLELAIADTFNDGAGGARLSGCVEFLLGVEHTMVLLEVECDALPDADKECARPDAEVFKSDLFARNAVGLTG